MADHHKINYLAEWGRRMADAAKAEGSVLMGGAFDPAAEEAYYDAARVLFAEATKADRLVELARPILFLQRHTVELVLKGRLCDATRLRIAEKHLAQDKVEGIWPAYPEGHDLDGLHKRLVDELKYRNLLVPEALTALVSAIGAFENGDPSLMRYDVGAKSKGGRRLDSQTVPVTKWQKMLVKLHRASRLRSDLHEIPEKQWTAIEILYRDHERTMIAWVKRFELGLQPEPE